MKKLPEITNALRLGTDFSDAAAWAALCKAVQEPSVNGFRAFLDCVSDPTYDGLKNCLRQSGRTLRWPVSIILSRRHPILWQQLDGDSIQ